MTDPISDMLIRVKNALSAKKPEVVLPYAKFKHSLAMLMEQQGWLKQVEMFEQEERGLRFLRLVLKYDAKGAPVISGVRRLSKPGQRIYAKRHQIPRSMIALRAVTVVSTSKGLMTDEQARKEKIGGEVICQIW